MKASIQKLTCFITFVIATFAVNAQTINKTFSGIKVIRLSTSAGNVSLAKSSSNDVQVKVASTYNSDDYQPIFEQSGSTLVLKEDFKNRRSVSGKSDWQLIVPDGLDVHISSGSGNVEAADLKITVSSNTGSGDYVWRNISGDSKINTGSGNIKLDSFQGDIDLNTGSGDITISKTNGGLHANTGSGSISLANVKGGVYANTGSGDIEAREIALTQKGSFNSGSGDVLLVLSSPLTNDLSLNSGSGDAVLDCKGVKLEGNLIMTANKRHGNIKAPFNFDKTEELDNDRDDNIRIRKTVQLGSSASQIKISTGSGTAEVRK